MFPTMVDEKVMRHKTQAYLPIDLAFLKLEYALIRQ